LCAECAEANRDQTLTTDGNIGGDMGWHVVGHYVECTVDAAGPCDHCGRTADTTA